MANGTENQLGEAIEEAQRKAETDLRWTQHHREHVTGDKETDRRIDEIQKAIDKAFAAEQAALRAALEDHHREHVVHDTAHEREHEATDLALLKAETASDKRFAGVNEFREQLREQASRLASTERVDALAKTVSEGFTAGAADVNRRFEEARLDRVRMVEQLAAVMTTRYDLATNQIVELQKINVARAGQNEGKAGTYAAIVAAVGFAVTAITGIVFIANILTSGP